MFFRRVARGAKSTARRLGLDIARYPFSLPSYRRSLILDAIGVDVVVDVGANVGQYGEELRRFGYEGLIISLEPLSRPCAILQAKAARDGNWRVIQRAAGENDEEITVNVAGNSISSSILPMLQRHAVVAPGSRYQGTEKAEMVRLDGLLRDDLQRFRRPFLKIDTQGFERRVLAGAGELISTIVGVELEMSLVPLYQGQMMLPEALSFMAEKGFWLAGLATGFWDDQTGEMLQVDGIFLAAEYQDGLRRSV